MKNVFLTSFVCVLLMSAISCKKDPKSDTLEVKEELVDTTAVVEDVVEEKKPIAKKKKKETKKKPKKETIALPPGTPNFTSVEARKYVRDYEAYVADYKKAVKSKDMDSFIELSEASSSLTRQYRILISKLSGEEMDKMSKYIQAKSKQIDELSKQM